MSDPEYRKMLYTGLYGERKYTNSFADFEGKYSPKQEVVNPDGSTSVPITSPSPNSYKSNQKPVEPKIQHFQPTEYTYEHVFGGNWKEEMIEKGAIYDEKTKQWKRDPMKNPAALFLGIPDELSLIHI